MKELLNNLEYTDITDKIKEIITIINNIKENYQKIDVFYKECEKKLKSIKEVGDFINGTLDNSFDNLIKNIMKNYEKLFFKENIEKNNVHDLYKKIYNVSKLKEIKNMAKKKGHIRLLVDTFYLKFNYRLFYTIKLYYKEILEKYKINDIICFIYWCCFEIHLSIKY